MVKRPEVIDQVSLHQQRHLKFSLISPLWYFGHVPFIGDFPQRYGNLLDLIWPSTGNPNNVLPRAALVFSRPRRH